ncbi:hypothetical protein [Micromonospora fulviviridis]|uniref:hypothetical protein n=1 Tax=Micromonospora fulviviridis TaxID=47860 RepID=UPI003789EF49
MIVDISAIGHHLITPFSGAPRVGGSAGVADTIDGIRAALESRPAELEKSAQRGRLAQQH